MPDQTNFETRLADAMRRYADRAPTDVDAMALAAEIASASTKERHRHPRWWPFGRNPQAHERSRTLIIATSATVALSVALVGGSLALLLSDPSEDRTPAITPEITQPPLKVRVRETGTSAEGYLQGRPMDVKFDLGMDLDPSVAGRTLLAGNSIRITLPEDFVSTGLPADVPSDCDVAARACNTVYLLQGWPQSYVPTTEDDYTVEMDGTHTFVITATRDLGPSADAPGIKQIQLMAPGFTNPEAIAEYRIEVDAQTGPDGALETDTASFVSSVRYGLSPTSAFMAPGENAAHLNPVYQQARVGESPEFAWDFLIWPSEEHWFAGDLVLEPPPENAGTVFPEGPTILDFGIYNNGVYPLAGWWIEGPEGATGAAVTADPVDEIESPVSGETVEHIRIYFTAGDLPGRYVFHYGLNDDEFMVVDVTD